VEKDDTDDTNVFLSYKSLDHLIEIMNSELIIIANWFKANRLSLNLEKTNFIIFSSLRKKLSTIKPLYINEIPRVQRWRTYGTHAQDGTRDNFAWHAPYSRDKQICVNFSNMNSLKS